MKKVRNYTVDFLGAFVVEVKALGRKTVYQELKESHDSLERSYEGVKESNRKLEESNKGLENKVIELEGQVNKLIKLLEKRLG